MARSRSRLSHAKELYYIVCIVVLVVITMFSLWGPEGYFEMKRTGRDLESQRARIEDLKRGNQERLKAIEALRSNREVLELLARRNGYGKKGEIVQQLPEEPESAASGKKR
jgi:cell division protein FtsB